MRGSWANISKNRLILFVISVLTFCTVWIGYGLLESAKYEQQANDKIGEYTDYTRDKVTQACAGGDKIENIKCVTEAFEAKREYEYNQSDLVAQRQSALWAYIMAAAAVFGIALSAVGVWLVKTTFDETRMANRITQDTMIAENRAWVKFPIETDAIVMTRDTISMKVHISPKNIGQSIALDVVCDAALCIVAEDYSEIEKNSLRPFQNKSDMKMRQNIWPGDEGLVVTKNLKSPSVFSTNIKSENYKIFLVCQAQYRTIFDKLSAIKKMTEIVYEIVNSDGSPFVVAEDRERSTIHVALKHVQTIQSDLGNARVT
jgi:hypothetical protein